MIGLLQIGRVSVARGKVGSGTIGYGDEVVHIQFPCGLSDDGLHKLAVYAASLSVEEGNKLNGGDSGEADGYDSCSP